MDRYYRVFYNNDGARYIVQRSTVVTINGGDIDIEWEDVVSFANEDKAQLVRDALKLAQLEGWCCGWDKGFQYEE